MALEQGRVPSEGDGGSNGGGDDGSRAPRLPRWTRQEILVLIQGKRVAESKARRIRTGGGGGAALGSSGQVEPKWASVSSYCRMHGVNRGPVQCRKRWSNLAGDYKKIKEWDSLSSDSFWSMRNDLRRERKLPGFFDKEVYDILDSSNSTPTPPPPPPPTAMFDCRRAATAEDGMFSDFDQEDSARTDAKEPPPAVPISGAAANEKEPASNVETGTTSQDGRKRKRFAFEGEEDDSSLQTQLIDVLERNGKALASHLDAQNMHFQLDREQRKNHSDSLVSVLNKLADALLRISDKL